MWQSWHCVWACAVLSVLLSELNISYDNCRWCKVAIWHTREFCTPENRTGWFLGKVSKTYQEFQMLFHFTLYWQITDSETHLKKLNLTCRTDLSRQLLCCNFWVTPVFQVQKQEKSGISRSFEQYVCGPNKTTSLLGGNLEIECQHLPVTVEARLCRFEDFDKVCKTVEDNNEVIF